MPRCGAWASSSTHPLTASRAPSGSLPCSTSRRPWVTAAAARAGLGGLGAPLPDGIQTRIGDGGRRLSAGEAQRIAIARAFLRDSELVVLDEPTAHLDARTAADLEQALLDLCAARTA